jgi:hypothetical protein
MTSSSVFQPSVCRNPRRRSLARGALTVLAAGGLVLALVACGSDDDGDGDSGAAPTADDSASTIGPVVVGVASADGSTVETTLERVIDLDVGDTDVTAWSATVGDPAILTFVAGTDDGSATFNPGLTPTAAGSTTVTLTDGDTTVEFTVVVSE